MEKVAIFGAAGAIGRALASELEKRAIPFRVTGRRREALQQAFGGMRGAEILDADLGDLRSASAAARGVDTIFYTVGVPYPSFHLHPKLMRVTVEAAAAMGAARLVVVSSVYSYGVPQTSRVAETHPRSPVAVKGRFRKEQEDVAMQADGKGALRSMVLHLPDFYGPHAENSLANMIFASAVAGKKATWLGPASTPHEFVFVPDTGPVLLELASRPDCFGERWNFAGPAPITGAEFIQKVYRATGRAPKYRTAGKGMLRVLGWFSPFMRELPEMLYLQETPVILDDSKLLARLGTVHKTSYDEGIRQTMAWMRQR